MHPEKNTRIQGGAKLCTTDYEVTTEEDLFDTLADQWEEQAVYPIHVQFNMRQNLFNLTDNDLLFIGSLEEFFLRFDGKHKMWYTMEDPDEGD